MLFRGRTTVRGGDCNEVAYSHIGRRYLVQSAGEVSPALGHPVQQRQEARAMTRDGILRHSHRACGLRQGHRDARSIKVVVCEANPPKIGHASKGGR